MLVDPREGARYVTTLASRVLRLQGGLVLRTVLVTTPSSEDDARTSPTLRSIA